MAISFFFKLLEIITIIQKMLQATCKKFCLTLFDTFQ